MGLPVVYRNTQENAIASYDYTDISSGVGIVDFLGYKARISGAAIYALGTSTLFSANTETSMASGGTLTFDLTPFNLPRTIKGDAYIGFSGGIYRNAGTLSAVYELTLFKIDSTGTVAQLGVMTTDAVTTSSAWNWKHYLAKMTIVQTQMKRGDFLRLTIKAIHSGDDCTIAHDPANRDGDVSNMVAAKYPSKLEVLIPFKIDL